MTRDPADLSVWRSAWAGCIGGELEVLDRSESLLSTAPVSLRCLLSWAFAGFLEAAPPSRQVTEFVERFMRKFELRKYLLSAYQPPDFKPASQERASVEDYVLFEGLLAMAYRGTSDVRFLNTALKVGEVAGLPEGSELHRLARDKCLAAVDSL